MKSYLHKVYLCDVDSFGRKVTKEVVVLGVFKKLKDAKMTPEEKKAIDFYCEIAIKLEQQKLSSVDCCTVLMMLVSEWIYTQKDQKFWLETFDEGVRMNLRDKKRFMNEKD